MGESEMNRDVNDLLQELADYEKNDPEHVGFDLRLQFSEIVVDALRRNGWTQRDLADRIGRKASFISRIVHSDSNCTFDTAGRILFALDVQPQLREQPAEVRADTNGTLQLDWTKAVTRVPSGGVIHKWDSTHGKEIYHEEENSTQQKIAV